MRPAGVQMSVVVSVQESHVIVAFSLWWNKQEIIVKHQFFQEYRYIMQYHKQTFKNKKLIQIMN